MQRRRLLKRTIAALSFLSLPVKGVFAAPSGSGCAMSDGNETWRGVASRLVEALPHHQEAAAIGQAHIEALEGTPRGADLVDAIMRDLSVTSETIEYCGATALRSMIRARNAEDFAANSTVLVKGWIFGATETRLFCLAALA